jgi:4-amino-4-deoxy-L-arabinose transferase-like glycosyltransferase
MVVVGLLLVLGTAVAGWELGRRVTGLLPSFENPFLRASASAAVGLLLISHAIFGLTEAGWMSRNTVLALTGVLGAVVVAGLVCVDWRRFLAFLPTLRNRWRLSLTLLAGTYLIWLLLTGLLPVTSIDELIYHLEIPRRLAESGGDHFFVDNVYAYFPELGENFFLFGYKAGGVFAARLFHTLYGALLVMALYGFCRPMIPEKYSVLAVALFATIPSVMVLAGLAYVDLMFALYSLLALLALTEYVRDWQVGWAVLVGVFAGGAWATKHTGLQLLMLLILVLLLSQLQQKRKQFPFGGVLAGVIALVIAAPYLVRNVLVTGWPLFPFSVGLFTLSPDLNWDPERSQLFLQWLSGFGTSGEGFLWGRILAPVRVFFEARFNDPSGYDGILGPVFLMTPFLVYRIWRQTRIRELVLFSLCFLYYWAFTTQQVRFLLPVVPVLCVLLAIGLARVRNQLLNGVVVILLMVNLVAGVRQSLSAQPSDYWFGRQVATEYQRERIVGFPLYEEANRVLGAEDRLYLVNMRNFGFLLEVEWRGDFIFEFYRLANQLEKAQQPFELKAFFEEMGITHLMMDEQVTFSRHALGPREQVLMKAFLEDHARLMARNPLNSGQSLWKLLR